MSELRPRATSDNAAPGDSQWPRWEVLKQDNERKAHQAVGSVHAADAEHALLMARTVFARRPSAVSMWVAPAACVHAWTAQELEGHAEAASAEPTPDETAAAQRYYVVRKSSNRRSMTFGDLVGEVAAPTLQGALARALREFADAPILALWLIEADAVVRSDPAVADPWFGPALDKTYKQQSIYSSSAVARKDAEEGVPE
ncbi:MAG: phenylacetic acid degradation protein [Truepera sp.]|jgi:ring-1,2-phenylacetyl-CoA epoxidase subunit PaaB|nr:phenylacetic acid degradation protein [Truepera sp.]HRN18575.1 phenylacetic acid degradation protein [Trueperaceae bacterium]HRQ11585.1 phenylacetic acid degradation protein [Trueperaceae bacterium]